MLFSLLGWCCCCCCWWRFVIRNECQLYFNQLQVQFASQLEVEWEPRTFDRKGASLFLYSVAKRASSGLHLPRHQNNNENVSCFRGPFRPINANPPVFFFSFFKPSFFSFSSRFLYFSCFFFFFFCFHCMEEEETPNEIFEHALRNNSNRFGLFPSSPSPKPCSI